MRIIFVLFAISLFVAETAPVKDDPAASAAFQKARADLWQAQADLHYNREEAEKAQTAYNAHAQAASKVEASLPALIEALRKACPEGMEPDDAVKTCVAKKAVSPAKP